MRRVRIAAGLGLLGIGLAVSVALIPPTVSYAADQAVALDRQAYVPDAGPDQYQVDALSGGGCSASQCPAPDPNAIHVAAQPNTMTYHSLLHVGLDPLQGETVTSLVVTLTVIGGSGANGNGTTPQDNVNTTAAILDAYPLANEFLASFGGCQTSANCSGQPTIDTSGPKVVGKVATDSAGNIVSFSFDVGPMLPYWSAKGTNTGFAVIPDAAAATDPWAIGFDRTLAAATATTTSSQPPTPGPVTTAPVNSSGFGSAGGSSGTGSQSTAPTAAAATATAKPAPAHAAGPIGSVSGGSGGGGTGGTGGTGVPIWLLVLGVSCAASVALLAQPVSQALSTTGGIRLGLVRELKIHPRMFAVAGTLLVWSSAWGVYAGATGAGSVGGGSRAAIASNGGSSSIPTYAPDTTTPGPTSSGSSGGSGGSSGGGGTINGSPIGAAAFNGANVPNAPSAHLYTGADDTVGITNTSIQMCAHSALTFANAFNIAPADLNVFWNIVNDPATDPYPHSPGQGGIYNRKIVQPGGADGISIQDDGYQPSKAVQAAQACAQQSGGDFFLLSGIGFDQIPNVRVWAEQNHMLYIHHIATQTAGLQYSFTMLPTLEQIGAQYGRYYLAHMSGKKIGIIERQSSDWTPGIAAFRSVLRAAGQEGNIKVDDYVQNNQGDYSKPIVDMQSGNNGGPVDAVLIWENALAADSIIQQAGNQAFVPASGWLMYPFNLTLYTLNQSSSNTFMQQEIQGMQGLIPWPAYTSSPDRCAAGGSGITRNDADYGRYLKEFQQFEAAYAAAKAKGVSSANMCADGGDLLFATWEAWKQVADLLVQCGPDCTRNKIAGLMLGGYKSQVGANCPVDFSGGDHHHGGIGGEDVYATKPENGGPGWVNTSYCQTG